MSAQSQSLTSARLATLNASDRVVVLRVARAAVAGVDPRELVPFDLAGESVLTVRRSFRSDPVGIDSSQVMDSLTDGAVAAACALVQLALVGVAGKTWRWFAAKLAERRAPAVDDGADAELLRDLDRIAQVAYEATAPFLSDEAERRKVAYAALAAYVQLRLEALEAVEAPRS